MTVTDGAAGAAPPHRRLLRRVLGRAGREVGRWRRWRVSLRGTGPVRVSRWLGLRQHHLRLGDPAAELAVTAGTVTLALPEPAALTRLATSGILTGALHRLRLRLATAPPGLLAGVRPPRLGADCQRLRWHRRGAGLLVEISWRRPYPVARALADLLALVSRTRAWPQTSGPVYALDRAAWLTGGGSWPQGRLADQAPARPRDQAGRPLGPYLLVEPPTTEMAAPIDTAIANPHGRRLVGAAAQYRLAGPPQAPILQDLAGRPVLRLDPAGIAGGQFQKYAVVTVAEPVTGATAAGAAVRSLAACGVVFAAEDPLVRASLAALDLVTVTDPATVTDLSGYAWSVQASRRAAITGDPALRRTALTGDGAVPLPAISAVLASMREEHIETCLEHLARQRYPALEVVVGLHGYDVPERTRRRWRDRSPQPLRVRSFPAELTLGAVLGQLSRAAEGELLTKLDDDDHYGPEHVTDLLIAYHTSGADLVAKGARFVHLVDRDETIDRAWAAPEQYQVTPAGGTILISRGTLQEVGGWSHSSRHVDADLIDRVDTAGGHRFRTHSLEYVYVRRSSGHTFATATTRLLSHAEQSYPGLPAAIINSAARA